MARVVLDVNVLISAVIAPLGQPRQVFSAWRAERYELITSEGIIAELEQKLALPRIARRYQVTPELARDTLTLLIMHATSLVVPTEARLSVTGDPEDDLVLATGRLARAEYLVTGDHGLLELGAYEGILIISPREFLQILER